MEFKLENQVKFLLGAWTSSLWMFKKKTWKFQSNEHTPVESCNSCCVDEQFVHAQAENVNISVKRGNPWGVLVLLKFLRFPVVRQQTCHPRDKNYMILQWKVYVKWTSTFCEKTDDVHVPTKFQQNKHTPVLFFMFLILIAQATGNNLSIFTVISAEFRTRDSFSFQS